jgi:tape measure domain-containing protein
MAADIAQLGFSIDSAPLSKGSAELDRLAAASKRAEDAATGMGSRVQEAAKRAETAATGAAASANNLGASYGNLEVIARRAAAAVSLIAAALASGALTNLADIYSDLNARVGLAVRNMEASGVVMDRLAEVARRTYSSLELTAESFIRNANTLRELGKSTNQVLDYTEALNLALVVSGAKGDRARMLQEALSRAMAGGALRGQELNTVIENGGRIAEVLAEELGVSTIQLRALGAQGQITGDVIFNALVKRLEQLQEEAERMPATIGDALLIIRNSFLQLIGVYDQQNKLSENLAMALISVADSLETVARVAIVAGTALAVAFSPAIVAGAVGLSVAVGTGLVTAFNTLRIAMMAHPLLALATILATIAMAVYQFGDQLRNTEGPLRVLGEAIDVVIDKLYLFQDIWRATVLKLTAEEINDDAMQAVALGIAKLNGDLEAFEAAKQAALGRGADTSALDATIESIRGQIKESTDEYWRMNEIREASELSFTELVRRESAKRRELWAWERGTTTTKDFGLDQAGSAPAPTVDTKAFDKRVEAVRRQVEAMKIEAETYGMTEAAAARYRVQKELENEAVKAGLALTPMMRAEILAEADALAQATAAYDAKRAAEEALTTIETEALNYERRLEMLREFEADRILSAEESARIRAQIERDYMMTVMDTVTATTSRIASTLDAIVGAMDTSSKKQFEQAKKLSIASAIIKGFEAAVSSYAAGAKIGGPPLGAAWAAVSLLATGAQIAKIKSTTFNSGSASGSVGSASTGVFEAPTKPQEQQQSTPPTTHITVTGSRLSKDDVRDLIEDMNAALRDGAGQFAVSFA